MITPQSSRYRLAGGVALIVVATCLAYWPSVHGRFVFDDDLLITNNPIVEAPNGLYWIWCTTGSTDYWPLTNTSFWLEWRLWGTQSTGYHITNLLLHLGSALLIWMILRKLAIPGAFLAALLFAVHPVNVESVAWISQRKNTLAMVFFLLSILWYLRAEERRVSARRERDMGRESWYWLSLAAFVLAMLSKGSVAILPLVLLLIVWWLRGEIKRADVARVAPFFIVAAALTAVNMWFQTHGSADVIRSASFAQRWAGGGAVVWFYLSKALAPLNLIFIYPQWKVHDTDWLWWLPLAAIAVVAMVLWRQRNSSARNYSRPLLLASAFYCIALAPVLGFTDVGFMKHSLVADHYQHIAIIAVVALLAAAWSNWRRRAPEAARPVVFGAAAAITVALMFLTWQQCKLYGDPISLYRATLEKNPDSWMVRNNLAGDLNEAGQSQEAIEQCQAALRLKPDFPEALYNLANAQKRLGQYDKAAENYRQAMRLKPDFADAYNNLGNVLLQLGKYQEASTCYLQAVRLAPAHTEAYANLATAYGKMDRFPDAVAAAEKALEIARSHGRMPMAQQIEAALNSYRAHQSNVPAGTTTDDIAPATPNP